MQHALANSITVPGTPPAVTCLVYTLDQVTAALGYNTTAAFRAARPGLEARGFPRRIPDMGARWSRAAVDGWIATAGTEG